MRPTSSPSAHSRNVLCELLQQQQSWENLKEAHEDLNGDDGAVCAGGRHSKRPSTAKHTDSRRHSVPASMFMDKLPCSKPWLPTGTLQNFSLRSACQAQTVIVERVLHFVDWHHAQANLGSG